MKKNILIVLILMFSISTKAQNPCNDSLYQVLKKTQLNHMTDREFSYFQEAEKACASFNQTKLQEDTKTENVKKATNAYVAVVVIGLLSALLIPFIFLQ
jgi:predicted Holliday junction resolvase-like endonuclease